MVKDTNLLLPNLDIKSVYKKMKTREFIAFLRTSVTGEILISIEFKTLHASGNPNPSLHPGIKSPRTLGYKYIRVFFSIFRAQFIME